MNLDENAAAYLRQLANDSEEWLVQRVISYARRQGYTAYTSTLQEAWQQSIHGLNGQLFEALARHPAPPELSPEQDYQSDPCTQYGILEAQRHRARGVDLAMFLGLMKYYRQSYVDLVLLNGESDFFAQWCIKFIQRFFDRIEIGFVVEWAGRSEDGLQTELQSKARLLANEKNLFLTIVESLAPPVILFPADGSPDYLNFSAARLFDGAAAPGAQYYGSAPVNAAFAWLREELAAFTASGAETEVFEKLLPRDSELRWYEIKLARMLDVSGKYLGTTALLDDITARKRIETERERLVESLQAALKEVKTLSGLLPICARCKSIRDDAGYWRQIEAYVGEHSTVQFTHGLCPACATAQFPELAAEIAAEELRRQQ